MSGGRKSCPPRAPAAGAVTAGGRFDNPPDRPIPREHPPRCEVMPLFSNARTLVRLLGYPDYRRYTIGNTISLIGTWMQRVTVGWLTPARIAISALDASTAI